MTEDEPNEGTITNPDSAVVVSRAGASGIADLAPKDVNGGRHGGVCNVDANSNLIEPRTLLPTMYADLKAGSTTWRVTAVFAVPAEREGWEECWKEEWEKRPKLEGWMQDLMEAQYAWEEK